MGNTPSFDLEGLLKSQGIDSDTFHALPLPEKNAAFMDIIPGYKSLPPKEKSAALNELAYGPMPTPESKGTKAFRGGALGLLSGFTGLPESTTPIKDAAKGAMTPPPATTSTFVDNMVGPAAPIARGLYGAGKEFIKGNAAALANPGGVPDADQTEQMAHGAGSAVGQVAQLATMAMSPELEGNKPGALTHPIEAIEGGAEKAGTENIFRGAVGGAGNDAGLRDSLEASKSDLAEMERRTPTKESGGVLKPDMRLRAIAERINDYKKDMFREQLLGQIKRWSTSQVDISDMKRDMLGTISKLDYESNQAAIKKLNKWVAEIPDHESLGDLEKRRIDTNTKLREYEQSSPGDKFAMATKRPIVEALKAEDNAIREAMGKELKRLGEPGVDGIEKRYAALSRIQEAMESQMNQAEAYRLFDKVRVLISPQSGIREGVMVKPSAGKLVQKGLDQIKRAGLEPPKPPDAMNPGPQLKALPETTSGGGSPTGKEIEMGKPHPSPHTYWENQPRKPIPVAPTLRGDELVHTPGRPPTTILPNSMTESGTRRVTTAPKTPYVPPGEPPNRLIGPGERPLGAPPSPTAHGAPSATQRLRNMAGETPEGYSSVEKGAPDHTRLNPASKKLERWDGNKWVPVEDRGGEVPDPNAEVPPNKMYRKISKVVRKPNQKGMTPPPSDDDFQF